MTTIVGNTLMIVLQGLFKCGTRDSSDLHPTGPEYLQPVILKVFGYQSVSLALHLVCDTTLDFKKRKEGLTFCHNFSQDII